MYWYALIGARTGTGQFNPVSLETAIAIAGFVVLEVVNAVGALLGGGVGLGIVGTLLLLTTIGEAAVRRPSPLTAPAVVGPAFGLLVGFLLIAVGRRYLGPEAAGFGRYLYIAATLLIPLIAALIGHRQLNLSGRTRRWAVVAVVATLEVSIVGNLGQLRRGAEVAQARSNTLRAIVEVELGPLARYVPSSRSVFFVPPITCLTALVDQFGNPTTDAWFPDLIPEPDLRLLAEARAALLGQDSPLAAIDVQCSPDDLAGLR